MKILVKSFPIAGTISHCRTGSNYGFQRCLKEEPHMKSRDNRRFHRASVDFPVTVEMDCGSGNHWVARALNVSVGGILVWSTRSMRMNVPLVIHFPSEWIRAFAVIIAIRSEGYYYGCEFINLSPKVVHALSRTVDHYKHYQTTNQLSSVWQQL